MKIRIHPLFFAMGILCAIFGGLTEFLICVLTALLHECGHIFCAARMGFTCRKINLMPYGASAVCEIEGITAADEIKLALAGPLVNFAIVVAVAGLWWFFPVTYAFSDTVFYANVAMLALNLLPACPLDGGRVLKCALTKFLRPKTVDIVLRVMCVAAAIAAAAAYFTAFKNVSLIAVALFLLVSAFEKPTYAEKINFAAKKKKRGREIKYVILDENATLRDALRFISSGRYLVVQLYGETFVDEITEAELYNKLMNSSI